MAADLAGQEAPETGAPRPRRVSTGVKWDERCQIPPCSTPSIGARPARTPACQEAQTAF